MTAPDFGPDAPAFLSFDSNPGPDPHAQLHRPRTAATRTRAQEPPSFPDRIEVPYWDGPDGEVWDRLTINGRWYAGTVSVDGQGVSQKLDVRSPPGADGARLVHKGYEPASVELTLRLWTEAHLEDFSALLPQIHPRRRIGARSAIDVFHPALALLLIQRVVVRTVGLLRPSGTPGLFECKLTCLEYAPPTPRSVTRAVAPPRPSGLGDIATALPPPRDAPGAVAPPSATNAAP